MSLCQDSNGQAAAAGVTADPEVQTLLCVFLNALSLDGFDVHERCTDRQQGPFKDVFRDAGEEGEPVDLGGADPERGAVDQVVEVARLEVVGPCQTADEVVGPFPRTGPDPDGERGDPSLGELLVHRGLAVVVAVAWLSAL
ncbi:hypothetical protein GCM10010219_50190 [Streptomyces netropsis]|nr:hypothetical protein GCM10010219_50190 [Streptomyces netropsis]